MTQTSTRNIQVIRTEHSPHAQLQPVPLQQVRLQDAFWTPRRETNRLKTLPTQFLKLEETGCLNNFRRAAGQTELHFEGPVFADSDAYKWLEAAAWTLAEGSNPELHRQVDELVSLIEGAQCANGYLNTFFMFEREKERFTESGAHELYCAGHLFQAAVALHRTTGNPRLLTASEKYANHMAEIFGPAEQGKKPWVDGHPEVEMALVELYRETGTRRYLDLAQYFLDARGHGLARDRVWVFWGSYGQDHKPFRDLKEVTGHAVRMVYLSAGAADLVLETGEQALEDALEAQWHNMTEKRMSVNGGIGPRHYTEGFGLDYELPSESAYNETCAAVGSIMWSQRMLSLTGEVKYADLIEHQLYNAALPGVSLDGQSYFYVNPLAAGSEHRRQGWFGCACCPPNAARLLATLPGYFYSTSESAVHVHLYAQSTSVIELPDGPTVKIEQQTNYPWDGRVRLVIEGTGTFSLNLRIPAWCEQATVKVMGEAEQQAQQGYFQLQRNWQGSTTIDLNLEMPVRYVVSHPHVMDSSGKVSVFRGPLLYCAEGTDHATDVRDLVLPEETSLKVQHHEQLNNAVVLVGPGTSQLQQGWEHKLYRNARDLQASRVAVNITLVPYYAWANREAGRMQVWLDQS
ncbi:glycoside hydrolase family 127 protein [Deinococcus cellulosilyticus]|uniref:Glycoside hydrolase family 127 protein n=1 Tax=Deinococcus cellulosilyticus (strain DSM 18568 / NBRC 106333 / KACC 11606 / 5516J-15) TaxID=1223518 RepID=A0A511N316_DEIC1|nr:beta-L-arabinofuranosidase domain-containing protein [Deinococcus cellulosilyticus]GEM46801.1 hypothetical protein DC3_24360 [Deinococcus cellulosilyticus NBRC 106333 = KACC 11606]